jgi:hypothetical protein
MLERDIEDYLVKRVEAMGGEVRKVQWIGRNSAPDRLVMLPVAQAYNSTAGRWTQPGATIWVELKNPKTIVTFPSTPRERAQHREHERMRKLGQRVEVVGTLYQVEALLS